jgi:hypothetical protein
MKKYLRKIYRLPSSALDRVKQQGNLNVANKRLANLKSGEYFVKPRPTGHVVQWASPNLVSEILDGKVKAADDPKWRDFGFKTKKDYKFWSWRICGLMCFKVALNTLGAALDETVAALTEKGAALGGYDVERDKGWFYTPLIKLAKTYGIDGKVYGRLSVQEIAAGVLDNRFFIASVHPDVIRGDLAKNPHDSKGHLVLVSGFRFGKNGIEGIYIENPSGRKRTTQHRAYVTISDFNEAFAKRGFALWKNQSAPQQAHSSAR